MTMFETILESIQAIPVNHVICTMCVKNCVPYWRYIQSWRITPVQWLQSHSSPCFSNCPTSRIVVNPLGSSYRNEVSAYIYIYIYIHLYTLYSRRKTFALRVENGYSQNFRGGMLRLTLPIEKAIRILL